MTLILKISFKSHLLNEFEIYFNWVKQPCICISIYHQTNAERVFMRNGKMGKESKVAERQREIEYVCASVDRNR
jgi:hypothetical protein